MENLELVSLAERMEIFEDQRFNMVGDVMKYSVVDLKWLTDKIRKERTEARMSPYIDIKPKKEDIFKNNNHSFSVEKDPETGIYYGIVNGIYPDGGIKWLRITIHDHLTLNLNKEQDLKTWAIIRFWSKIKNSPFAIEGAPYELNDPEVEANRGIAEDDALLENLIRMKKLRGKSLANFCRLLGVFVAADASPKTLRFELSKLAKQNPVEFKTKFESVDREVEEAFYSGKALGLIKHDMTHGYMFRNHTMGGNEIMSIGWLKENPEMLRECYKDIDAKDDAAKKLEAFVEDMPAKSSGPKKGKEKDQDDL